MWRCCNWKEGTLFYAIGVPDILWWMGMSKGSQLMKGVTMGNIDQQPPVDDGMKNDIEKWWLCPVGWLLWGCFYHITLCCDGYWRNVEGGEGEKIITVDNMWHLTLLWGRIRHVNNEMLSVCRKWRCCCCCCCCGCCHILHLKHHCTRGMEKKSVWNAEKRSVENGCDGGMGFVLENWFCVGWWVVGLECGLVV